MSAYTEILKYLQTDEVVEAISFGGWGGDLFPRKGERWVPAYGEPGCPEWEDNEVKTPTIPFAIRGTPLSLDQAKPYLEGWSFFEGFGAAECYAVYIWTNQRVIWVAEYDGSTRLMSCPRNPEECQPSFS